MSLWQWSRSPIARLHGKIPVFKDFNILELPQYFFPYMSPPSIFSWLLSVCIMCLYYLSTKRLYFMDEMKLQEIRAPYNKSWMNTFKIKWVKGDSNVFYTLISFCHHLIYLGRIEHAGFCWVYSSFGDMTLFDFFLLAIS